MLSLYSPWSNLQPNGMTLRSNSSARYRLGELLKGKYIENVIVCTECRKMFSLRYTIMIHSFARASYPFYMVKLIYCLRRVAQFTRDLFIYNDVIFPETFPDNQFGVFLLFSYNPTISTYNLSVMSSNKTTIWNQEQGSYYFTM